MRIKSTLFAGLVAFCASMAFADEIEQIRAEIEQREQLICERGGCDADAVMAMSDEFFFENILSQMAHIAELQQRYENAKAREQSVANRMLGAATIAMTGAGGQLLLAGIAEGRADDEWGARIENITASITCRISGATVPTIPVGESGMTPMRSRTSVELRDEYLTLARATRETKEELGLPPGIESDAIIDMRDTYAGNQVRVGNELDLNTAAERRDSGQNERRIQTGAALAIGGTAVGLIGNHQLNVKNDGAAGAGNPKQVQQRR